MHLPRIYTVNIFQATYGSRDINKIQELCKGFCPMDANTWDKYMYTLVNAFVCYYDHLKPGHPSMHFPVHGHLPRWESRNTTQ